VVLSIHKPTKGIKLYLKQVKSSTLLVLSLAFEVAFGNFLILMWVKITLDSHRYLSIPKNDVWRNCYRKMQKSFSGRC
jgi:hypothetical protein